MKYISRMATKLLLSIDVIDEEDKIEVKKEFDESFERYKQPKTKVMQLVNAVMEHPFGVFLWTWVFIKTKAAAIKADRETAEASTDSEFKQAYKQALMQEMLDDLNSD